jgi:hypothetical protein
VSGICGVSAWTALAVNCILAGNRGHLTPDTRGGAANQRGTSLAGVVIHG